eukprot:TRINITY_DN3915_c3_g1_i1.p1 TRINITY_DN3915_c3_g1~~TRINITY_DN3915_c3_g1_i1.p1  ORF type:complete len:221 (+),score=35.11 TRINITY_DN3915_c3_g1_i1:48-665(+)
MLTMLKRRQLELAALPEDFSENKFSEDVGMAQMVSSIFHELMGGRFDLALEAEAVGEGSPCTVRSISGLFWGSKRRRVSKMQVHITYKGSNRTIDGIMFYQLLNILKANYTSTLKIQRKAETSLISKEECCICMATQIEQVLPCSHGFCNQCILSWSRGVRYTCPCCRAPIQGESTDDTFAFYEPSVEDFVESLSGDIDLLLLKP